MSQRFYPAVLERGDGGALALWFPDFPDCIAGGRSQEEAMQRASEALEAAMEAAAEAADGELPEPTPVEAVRLPQGCDFVAFVAVGAEAPNPSERVNVYLPQNLIRRVDRLAAERGMSRSSFFGWALTHAILTTSQSGSLAPWLMQLARKHGRQARSR